MSARDELAEVIADHFEVEVTGEYDACAIWATPAEVADAILAAGYSKPCTITTVDELDTLPDGSVVMNCFGDAITIHWELRDSKPTAYHHLVKYGPATCLHEGVTK